MSEPSYDFMGNATRSSEPESESQRYRPEEYVRVWTKSVGSVVLVLERLKGTPALYFRVFHGGSPVFEVGPFFSRRSFETFSIDWSQVAVELEKRGEKPLATMKKEDWEKLFEEVLRRVPPSPVLPPVEEVGNPAPVTVEDLARHGDLFLGSPVVFDGVIVGRSEIKTVPVAVRIVRKEGKKREELVLPFNLKRPEEAVKLITHQGEPLDEARFFILQIQQYMGHDKFTVYVVGCDVPKSKMVKVKGVVVSEGRRAPFKVVVLATQVEPLNEVVEKLSITPDLLKEAGIRASSYEELKRLVDENLAPQIRGRSLEKLAAALTLFSVESLSYGGSEQPGLLRTLFYGDTKTGKSSIAKWAFEALGLGAYTVAETGSRAGLLYTIDTETRTVIWGALTLADREYAVVDGFDKMNSEEWKECREALTTQKVVVMKKAQAVAPFRVRLFLCANTSEPMKSYALPVEAITDIPTLRGRDAGASITRIDLFIPFADDDVPKEEIVRASLSTRAVDVEMLKRKVLTAWKASRAVFDKRALEGLGSLALSIMKAFEGVRPPVIHNDYMRTVLKVAAAFASLLGRYQLTEKGLDVLVTEDIVPFVEGFFREYLNRLKLPLLKSSTPDVEETVRRVKEEPLLARALLLIHSRQQQNVTISKEELGSLLGIRSHDKQQELVNRLASLGLITSKRGVGLLLTTDGRVVVKMLKEGGFVEGGGNPEGVLGSINPNPEKQILGTTHVLGSSSNVNPEKKDEKIPRNSEGASFFSETQLQHFIFNNPNLPRINSRDGCVPTPQTPCGDQLAGITAEEGSTPFGNYDIGKSEEGGKEGITGKAPIVDEPGKFGVCYMRLSARLREEPEGLSEEELIRYAGELGFSVELAGKVIQFMKTIGKAREEGGRLVWS